MVTKVEHADSTASSASPGRKLRVQPGNCCVKLNLQELLQALWYAAADERMPGIGKVEWHTPASPRRFRAIFAHMFRPRSSAIHSGHAECLLENSAAVYPVDRQPI
jgi:hypothetical protein